MNRTMAATRVCALLLCCATACTRRSKPAERSWPAMGTFASVALPEADAEKLDSCVTQAAAVFNELTGTLSVFDPKSDIATLNRAAGKKPVPVSSATHTMLSLSLEYAAVTGGCFDPTIGPLVRFWGFHHAEVPASLPARDDVQAALRLCGYRHLKLKRSAAFLEQPGMAVDLGGIAKGFAVDVCFDKLLARNVSRVMVNLGGNIRAAGSPGNGPWRVGVRHPFDGDSIVGVIRLIGGQAVATSGNYERFVTIEGKRYAHIIDPRSGMPVQGMAAVTVVAPTAVEADALSTALFVMGTRQGCALLSRRSETHAIFVEDQKPLHLRITPGMQALFTPEPAFAHSVRVLPPTP